jgi:uncharacterized membrane protein
VPIGVNDQQTVVGYYPATSGGRLGYTYDGTYHILTPPTGSTSFYAMDINNSGQIVGWDGAAFGIIYDNGQYELLQLTDAERTYIYGINDNNLAAGYYFKDGTERGFVYDLITKEFWDVLFPDSTSTMVFGLNNIGQIVGG